MKIYEITPIGKPRMTQRDRWHKRPATATYWAYKEQVRLLGIRLPESGYHVTFVIPMPKSWSKTKRAQYVGQPHQPKPDKDNLEKALLDAVFDEDSHVWDGRVTKIWGETGQIIIEEAR
ncbi:MULTISPECIES: RusA family crossover junction endodeoxyribonuclease [Enterobacter]|uniref:RusA family crossover junction endodeoxyribonuclease n=1 Tax=Enterobacter dykesii TaxID=2797506 RepID=A0AAU7J628_9ENTR|nr:MULTISPECIES: RusA family crossover junction endodeoxyribonuclease [Enterobacter]KAA0528910.1 RusA family crossover junction endodeoxyribonuclease [Enterobacter asburiae]KAA0532990.1 RusA family crossover junction endodeoxyribonuclease [Enterobacter dykesii]